MQRDPIPVWGIGRRQSMSQSCYVLAQVRELNGPVFSPFAWSKDGGRVRPTHSYSLAGTQDGSGPGRL